MIPLLPTPPGTQTRVDGQEQEATRNAREAFRLKGVEERLRFWNADLVARENAHQSLEERYARVTEAYQVVDYNRRLNEMVLEEETKKLAVVRTEYATLRASLETLTDRRKELVASLEDFRRDVVLPHLYCPGHSARGPALSERSDREDIASRSGGESPDRNRTRRSGGESSDGRRAKSPASERTRRSRWDIRESGRRKRRAISAIPPLRIKTRYVVTDAN